MKKLFLLIPATLILTISMAQDTKSDMSQKKASLDGKSFKITLTTAGSESINPQSGDKSGMNSGTQSGEMKSQDGTSMEKASGSNQTQSGTDKNATAKKGTLKFKDGMLKSSMSGPVKVSECAYSTTSSSSSSDAIAFTANCNNDGKSGSGNSGDNMKGNSGTNSNNSGSTNSSGSDITNTTTGTNSSTPGTSGTSPSKTNSAGSSGTTTPSSNGTNSGSTGTTGNSSVSTQTNSDDSNSPLVWSGTVTGNTISGTVRVMENGKNMTYSFTGNLTTKSDELGMEK